MQKKKTNVNFFRSSRENHSIEIGQLNFYRNFNDDRYEFFAVSVKLLW